MKKRDLIIPSAGELQQTWAMPDSHIHRNRLAYTVCTFRNDINWHLKSVYTQGCNFIL